MTTMSSSARCFVRDEEAAQAADERRRPMRFRKKPVVIEAEQWFPGKRVEGVTDTLPQHALDDVAARWPTLASSPDQIALNYGWCPTLEGGHIVSPGDWIVTGVKGEKYPCKPDIFAATYEPAE